MSMPSQTVRVLRGSGRATAFLLVLACACVLFGAIPGLSVPTLTQALWASGFAQSYANAGSLTLYAGDIGLPTPAPIAFGLSGTFVQGLIIGATGMLAIDAYTTTVVLYLALAVYGAQGLARHLGAGYLTSLAAALLWISLPIVCLHTGFSMLSLGFALLPTYLFATLRVVEAPAGVRSWQRALLFVATCILAVFMDGYSFVLFFVAAAVFCSCALAERTTRKHAALFVLPAMAVGFGCSSLLYIAFIGDHRFHTYGLEFFRAWGVDVAMLVVPTHGMHWLWDRIGWFEHRSPSVYWGDASIWITTFIAPLVASAIAGYVVFENRKRAAALLVVAVLGLYMSLGPSLKVHSTKRVPGISIAESGPLMPERFAIAPTGSGLLSEHVRGFREMRAAYRWEGLAALGLWSLTIGLLVRLERRHSYFALGTVALLGVLFAPHVGILMRAAIANRVKVIDMNTRLSDNLRALAKPGGALFFAPHGNDFMAGYLAATSGLRTYNIGGDKNGEIARAAWPDEMRRLDSGGMQPAALRADAQRILLRGDATAVVFPYFDLSLPAQMWPPPPGQTTALRNARLPLARVVATSPCFTLWELPLFSAVSLSEFGTQQRDAREAGAISLSQAGAACTSSG